MSHPGPVTVHMLMRSALVVAGLLLLGVGIGNTITGQVKVAKYERIVGAAITEPPADSPLLFPKATEAQERREIARIKLDFYGRLLTAGQWLSALGFALVAGGVLRLRMRTLREMQESPASN